MRLFPAKCGRIRQKDAEIVPRLAISGNAECEFRSVFPRTAKFPVAFVEVVIDIPAFGSVGLEAARCWGAGEGSRLRE